MRAPILLLVSILSLVGIAAACGGGVEVGPGPGDGGSSSSSSGGASSTSSGASGSSSGGASSSSGTSSGGATCQPLPGCNSTVECAAPGGCGTCFCENGGWTCSGGCGDDVSDGYPVDDAPYGSCPVDPPSPGSLCEPANLDCSYAGAEGCGYSCYCNEGTWACAEDPCPPPVCAGVPPASGTACDSVGGSCFYPSSDACGGEEECDCEPSGIWDCFDPGCADAGPPDTGTGTFDAGSPCPGVIPSENAACSTEGIVCSYDDGCEYNCLCAASGWVCAAEGPCSSPPPPGGG